VSSFIHDVGRLVTYGAAVYVHQAHSITVENNVLARSPRNLLSVFGVCYLYTAGGGPYATAVYPDTPPVIYGENISFFSQYNVTTASNLTFRFNDVSHACLDSQDCGVWEAWGPGRDNFILQNSFHDTWAPMGQTVTLLFPDSANNFFQVSGNVLHHNLQSGVAGQSPGGSTGMVAIGLKGYNQTFTDNIVADSSHNAAVWIGPSGDLTLGLISVLRNILSNFSADGHASCGRGEYSQSGSSICYRDLPMVATATVGSQLNATTGAKAKVNPDWFGFSSSELEKPVLSMVDQNVYYAPLEPSNSSLQKLRPDIDRRSLGGVADPGFWRTSGSQWWNRTHLDYRLASNSPALKPPVSFQETNVSHIGLIESEWPFDSAEMFIRSAFTKIHTESADRAFGLFVEPGFGISFPRNKGTLAATPPSAFARFSNVDFGGAAKAASSVQLRVCTPQAQSGIQAATRIEIRDGSPDGLVLASAELTPATATASCGYVIGSYWAPGTDSNDDPQAMVTIDAKLTPSQLMAEAPRRQLFLSVQGGHAVIDWFQFK
jgi:hypothetical protein